MEEPGTRCRRDRYAARYLERGRNAKNGMKKQYTLRFSIGTMSIPGRGFLKACCGHDVQESNGACLGLEARRASVENPDLSVLDADPELTESAICEC